MALQTPAAPASWSFRSWRALVRLRAGAGITADRLASALDRWDGMGLAGLGMLTAGLWRTFHLGIALTVVGALVLGLGVAGAIFAPDDTKAPNKATSGRGG